MVSLAEETCNRWQPAPFIRKRPDVAERVINTLLANYAENFASIWDAISALNLEKSLHAIRCRTLIMSGELDKNAPVSAGMLIAGLIPDARFFPFPMHAIFYRLKNWVFLTRYFANLLAAKKWLSHTYLTLTEAYLKIGYGSDVPATGSDNPVALPFRKSACLRFQYGGSIRSFNSS